MPAEGPRGEDFWNLVALGQLAQPPGHEAVREHGPDRRPTERDIVVLQEALEPRRGFLTPYPTEDALREARRLDDLEALQDRRLGRDQLQQQTTRLLDVPQTRVVPGHVHALVHRPPHSAGCLEGLGFIRNRLLYWSPRLQATRILCCRSIILL